MVRIPPLPQPKLDYLPFKGGLDTETPPWEVAPGKLRESQNYEIGVNGGYQDIVGYERFDGQECPSDAAYAVLNVTITGSFSAGDTITGVTTGDTGVVVLVDTSGAQAFLVITKIVGSFDDASEDLQVSAVTEGNTDAVAIIDGAATTKLHGQYRNLAADSYRADISAVTGSGSILGVTELNDVKYAFRNNAGGSAAALFKSTSSGWAAVALGRELSFTSGGTYVIAEGDTITGAISTETAVVTRVVLESGSFSGGDASGRLIFASQSGAFQAENLDVDANLDVATIAADSTAITLLPDGRYEFDIGNVEGGEAGSERIYGVDRVNRGFEFDGTVFVPINTGMTTDAPNHVRIHKSHLFFAFAGSAQHSGITTPYIWSPVFGAGELATGDTITGFMTEPGAEGSAALSIFNRNRTHILYGTSSSDWNLVTYRSELGAFAHTIQQIATTMFLDDRGITNLRTVQAYGNFAHSTLSLHVQAEVNAKRSASNASCIVRDKNQYRIFFTDKTSFYITMEGYKIKGIMPITLGHKVESIFSLEAADGTENIFFGSDNGFVYQMEKGTSFDGDPIEARMVLHFHYLKSLGWLKKFMNATMEARGTGYAEFEFSYELNYADVETPMPGSENNVLEFSVSRWDSFTWDSFFWDGRALTPTRRKLFGSAENISLLITKNSDYFEPIRHTGAYIRYLLRRQLR
jgi:hypothetical protein